MFNAKAQRRKDVKAEMGHRNRGENPLRLCVFALMILSQASYLTFAQTRPPVEATLTVKVLDPNRAAIPGARINLVAADKGMHKASSGTRGELTLTKLPPGEYHLRAEAKGFASRELSQLRLTPGVNELEVQLDVAQVQEEMVVDQDKREANTDRRGNAFSSVLTAEQIALLPDDPDELEDVIRQMAGPGATMRVNGFRGGKLPPKSQIREIRFRMNPYAAENHESDLISVDISTKPGIDLWHGSLNSGFRDESLNARNPVALFRGPEQTRRFAFDLGGPIWKNHTSLFLSADGANEYDSKTILAELPGGRFNGLITRPARRLNLSARAEYALGKTHTLRAEFQRNVNRRDNLGVGDFDLADRAYSSDIAENLLRVSDSGAIAKSTVNEFRFQSTWQSVGLDSLSDVTTTIVQNAFNSGGAQILSARRLNELELAENVDFALGKHVMRTGALFEAQRVRSDEMRNAHGTFVFASLDELKAGRPITYSQRIGDGGIGFTQYQLGWYWQDDFRLRKSLSLSFGLRQEMQNTVSDRSNFAPRLGLAWSPFKKGKTTIRAGAGVFYDWFSGDVYEQTLRVDGVKQRDLIVRNPGYPNPLNGSDPIVLPPSRVQIAADMQQPAIYQASVGVEQQFPGNVTLRVNYNYQRGIHLLRGRNINAPLATGDRPNPALGNVTQIESSANSFNSMLHFNFNWARPGRFFVGANYILSRSTSEADGPTALPADNLNMRGERGPSLNDARHRFFFVSNVTLWRGLRLGTTLQASSATPYNITTGFDDNADTVINDRPRGVNRNSARGSGRHNANLRLSYGFGWGQPREPAGGGGPQVRIFRGGEGSDILGSMGSFGAGNKRYRVEFYVQAFNAFNNANLSTFSGVLTSPFYGQATAALPGRRTETGMRFSF